MATVDDNFLKQFHCLEGTTIAQRQKNFFKLLHDVTPQVRHNTDALDAISANLNPRNYLECLFQVDLLIYFRRTQELVSLLKQGNDVFVSKLAKQIWFFTELLGDISAERFVNETLPYMSFSVRMKVLKKLSRYMECEKFEQIYDALVCRYGIYLASRFITGCGPAKIRQILQEYPLQLTSTQLIIMHGKDRELVDFYFTQTKTHFNTHTYNSLIKYICNSDHTLLDCLRDKYDLPLRFGRRATKKFVVMRKDEIVKNPYAFEHLDMRAVFRKIGRDSVQLFTNALPPHIEQCLNRDWLFSSFPERYHYSLFIKIFQTHYNTKFADHPSLITEELLQLIPDNTERAALAKIKIDHGEDKYLKYLLIEESIQLIKEKINLTSDIHQRGELIRQLIETCHFNKNTDALLQVMKYFSFRHKNDEFKVHLQFINNIEHLFGYKKFTEEMWASLNELLTVHMLKFDQTKATYKKVQTMPLVSLNIGISAHQKLSYLEFLFTRNENINGLIEEYFSAHNQSDYDKKFGNEWTDGFTDEYFSAQSQFPDYANCDKKFGKYFLLFAINNLARYTGNEDATLRFNCTLFSEIDSWNYDHKDDQLSFYDFPVLLDTFNYVIRNCEGWEYDALFGKFNSAIFTTEQNIHRNEYLEIYWERFSTLGSFRDFPWFLKHDPFTIVAHLDVVFRQLTDNHTDSKCVKIWKQIKKLSHLQIDERSIDMCIAKLSDEQYTEVKANFIPCVSILMKPEAYSALADSYRPENKKLDLQNEKEVKRYTLQCAIATNFKNTKSFRVLPSLLHYCAGDYFKNALGSLQSLLYRTPENELPQYLNYLSKKAVSVRKHALYMTCALSTSSKVEEMLTVLNKQEGVQSLQKHMFSATVKYFVKNPSDVFFELVKLSIRFISKADDESLSGIIEHLAKIPQVYKFRYVQHAWKHLEDTVNVWEKLRPLKESILGSVDTEMSDDVTLEFGIRIIRQHFMTEDLARDLNAVQHFMYVFVSTKDEKQLIFEEIFGAVDRCKSEEGVFCFLRNWYDEVMNSASGDLKYMEPYVSYFESRVSMVKNFNDFIKIFFLKRKLESGFWTADALAEKVLAFFEKVVTDCGQSVIHLFAGEMRCNLLFFVRDDVAENDFYYSMMRQRPVPIVGVLLLQVVPEPWYYNQPAREEFIEFLQRIRAIDDVGVEICVQCKYEQFIKTGRANLCSV